MNELTNGPGAARLDELAAVTSEYAKYSRAKAGLGNAAAGIWMVMAGSLLSGGSHTAGERMLIPFAIVWIAASAAARAYYQRHGNVLQVDEYAVGNRRWWRIVFIYVLCVMSVLLWAKRAPGVNASFALGASSFMAVPVLVAMTPRGTLNHGLVAVFLIFGFPRGKVDGQIDRWSGGGVVVFGLLLVVTGVLEHSKYRRLERRLVALKEGG